MISKPLFILSHQIMERKFISTYKYLLGNQWKKYQILKNEQERQLKYMIDYVYKNVPYYHKLFKDLKIIPEQIKTLDDLQKIPILNKNIIKSNWEEFTPIKIHKLKYYHGSTGGSTGTPLKFRLSKFDRFLAGAVLYRGWGYSGYELGDKMVFLAGASLDIGSKSNYVKRIHEIARNIKKLSSFDMGNKEMHQYEKIINSFKPNSIRGYPSSIYFFAKWIEENDISIHSPSSVFTTAEKLYPNVREKIGCVFDCDVYDTYGLNDGGLSAFECPEQSGLHIDTERSIMEVIDKDGNPLDDGEGEIIATSLYNYAMPFIRYDTGDLGYITDDVCSCGRGYKLLKELVGRSVDVLITPEGKNVHGWFFLFIFWEYCKGIKEYQVIQEKVDEIVIKIVPEKDFDEKQLDKISEIVRERSAGWNVEYKFVDTIDRTQSGKYKFIINNVWGN